MRLLSTFPIFIFLALTATALAGCVASEGEDADTTPPTAASAARDTSVHNTLTAEERTEGWTLLFDGTAESLQAHWRGFQMESVPGSWQAEDGTITFVPGGNIMDGSIINENMYDDFVLKLDWKISEGGNSGIFFLVTEEYDSMWKTGPEMQVIDNPPNPDQDNLTHLAGANYDLHPAAEEAARPTGEWNQVRIEVRDGHVEYWLNGTKTVEYEIGSEAWEQLVAESKFGEFAYALAEEGHIGLQDHGSRVWYRDIKILPLD